MPATLNVIFGPCAAGKTTYALDLGSSYAGFVLGDAEQAYLARTKGRDAYKRALERSHEGVVA